VYPGRYRAPRNGGRVDDCSRLESGRPPGPGVRIPPVPPTLGATTRENAGMHRSKRALSRTIFVPRSSETEPEKKSEIVRRRLSHPAVRACAAVGRMGRIRAASSTLVHGAWSTRTRLSAQSVRACVIRPRTNEGAPVGSRSKWRRDRCVGFEGDQTKLWRRGGERRARVRRLRRVHIPVVRRHVNPVEAVGFRSTPHRGCLPHVERLRPPLCLRQWHCHQQHRRREHQPPSRRTLRLRRRPDDDADPDGSGPRGPAIRGSVR
jgi:hypothetical protein